MPCRQMDSFIVLTSLLVAVGYASVCRSSEQRVRGPAGGQLISGSAFRMLPIWASSGGDMIVILLSKPGRGWSTSFRCSLLCTSCIHSKLRRNRSSISLFYSTCQCTDHSLRTYRSFDGISHNSTGCLICQQYSIKIPLLSSTIP